MSQYGRTFLFSCYVAVYRCSIIIQIMYYAVKIANPSHYIRNYKERKSTIAEQKSSLYLLGRFQEKYQRAKIILSNLGRIFKTNFPTTCREYKTHFRPSWSEV